MTLRSWSDMEHDRALAGEVAPEVEPESWAWKFSLWLTYYWWPTRRWMPGLTLWWHHTVRRYPRRPPIEQDPVAMALGLVPDPCDGSPASVRAAELRARADRRAHNDAEAQNGGTL